MKVLDILSPLVLASTAIAFPTWGNWNSAAPQSSGSSCLTQSDADDVVAKFIKILDHSGIVASNATAQALIGDGFFEKSDSINMLAGYPVGAITFPGKAEYIQGVLLAPSVTQITSYKVMVAGCTNVLWYWNMAGIGTREIPVNGFSLFEMNPKKQIAHLFVEFNNIGWGIDTGFSILNRNGTRLPLD